VAQVALVSLLQLLAELESQAQEVVVVAVQE
jgi:hypothetical protein